MWSVLCTCSVDPALRLRELQACDVFSGILPHPFFYLASNQESFKFKMYTFKGAGIRCLSIKECITCLCSDPINKTRNLLATSHKWASLITYIWWNSIRDKLPPNAASILNEWKYILLTWCLLTGDSIRKRHHQHKKCFDYILATWVSKLTIHAVTDVVFYLIFVFY